MSNYGIDYRRMPLGRLSRSQVLQGYDVLRKIEAALKEIDKIDSLRGTRAKALASNRNKLREEMQSLSSQFYTVRQFLFLLCQISSYKFS